MYRISSNPKLGRVSIFLINFIVVASLVALTTQERVDDDSAPNNSAGGQQQVSNGQDISRLLRKAMSVSVPVFYDMVRNGSSMGINVLSGLVKVERGDEAARNGLQGSRPLSVRVFGVPVYERGHRVRPVNDEGTGILSVFTGNKGNAPRGEPEADVADELPEP